MNVIGFNCCEIHLQCVMRFFFSILYYISKERDALPTIFSSISMRLESAESFTDVSMEFYLIWCASGFNKKRRSEQAVRKYKRSCPEVSDNVSEFGFLPRRKYFYKNL